MTKLVTRTFTQSDIYAVEVSMDNGEIGTVDLDIITVPEKVNEESAMRIVRKTYGKKGQYLIKEIVYNDELRAMSVEDFLRHSEVVEKSSKFAIEE